jgi:sensor c-di-GMP phosphodiesterase-like protein
VGSFAHSASNINNYLELCKVEASKRHGNYCVRFNALLLQNVSKRTFILQSIEEAQKKNELFMVYQPQISLKDESVVGVEALMRWKKEDGSIIAPGDFIPVLEMSEFISDVTFWANQQCFSDLKIITSKLPNCRLSLNISANILVKEKLLETLTDSIKTYNLKPEQIELEVTESAIMEDMDAALTQIRKLRALGFRVSIDDFGTGHSSLSYLVEFPIDQLKIDKSFIRQITQQKQSLTVVNTIISLGKDLGLDVIAEGTETLEQVTLLKQHRCDEAQGFYYAKPMALPELLVWLEQRKLSETVA